VTTYSVVTTCNGSGWASYGRRMVITFKRFWPQQIPLFLYNEGFKPDRPVNETRELPGWLTEFKARNTSPERRGVHRGKPYNMLFDAVRFSHKVAAFLDAARKATSDVLIWIDADVLTHAPVTEEFLDRLWSGNVDAALAWLWRSHKYPETGFYMVKLNHPATPGLLASLEALYTQDSLFQLEHWTDCHALAAAVERMHVPWVSLSGIYHSAGHPFINGPLGAVMDHLKGARKQAGRSRRIDMKFRREEAYWRGVR
jgi:hypothetical protein